MCGLGMVQDLEAGDPRQVGRYRIVGRIGEGGMGQVFLAHSPSGRAVAIKVVRPELAREADFRRRFAREVAAAKRVNGAFTAGVVDADPEGTPAWLATVYVPGVSLAEALAGHGPWSASAVVTLAAGLVEALEAVHAAGVVHRDLKPSNVLLAADGPRVIDFGISLESEASALTQTGMSIGTPGFMSPEQLLGERVGPASDVFALGAILAYTATGTGPWGTGTPYALHFRAVYEQPDLSAVPAELRDIVATCLAKTPDERPTLADLLEHFTGKSSDGPTTVTPVAATTWMPAPVARLVQEHATGTITPSPVPASPVPGGTGAPVPAPAPTAVQPPAPDAPKETMLHQAATRTGEQPTPDNPVAADPVEPTDGALEPTMQPAEPHGTVSRRRALFALTGGVLAAASALTVWNALDGDSPGRHTDGSGSGSATGGSRSGAASASPRPATAPGTALWTFPAPAAVYSPVVADGVVYVGSDDHRLYAVDTSTGKKRWHFGTGGEVSTAPAVADGSVFFGSGDHRFYAVDAASGKKRWTFTTGGAVHSTPAVANGVVFFGSRDHLLYAVDAASGRKRWTFPAGATVGSPVLADGVLYFGTHDHRLYAVDAASGKKRWTFTADDVVRAPAIADGTVYVGSDDHHLYALDAASGKKRWSFPAGGPVRLPVVADGVVYVGSDDHRLYAVDAPTGKQRWSFISGNAVRLPVVADGVVYVGSDDRRLYAVNAADGKRRWEFATGDAVVSSPVVAEGVVYTGSQDRSLYAIKT